MQTKDSTESDGALHKDAPKPRDPGQKIRRGERKWLLRNFIGRDAQGRRHYRNETFLGSSKDADKAIR